MARDAWAVMDGATRKVDAEDARHAIAALFTPGTTAVNARQGLRPGPGSPGLVTQTGTPGINVLVNAHQGLVTATRGAGGYIVTEPAQLTVPILNVPADPSNQRNDLIIHRQLDTYYSDPNTLGGVIRVQGTPSGTPADPSLAAFPDYIPLARIRVTAGATTITNAMIDDLRPGWVVAAGGTLPIRTVTERNALTPWDGAVIYRQDRDWIEVHDGTAWRVQGIAFCASIADLANVTDPVIGQLGYAADIAMVCRWNGTSWIGAIPVGSATAAHRHDAQYQRATNQPIPSNSPTPLEFPGAALSDSNDVTVSGTNNNTFTLNRIGLWRVSAGTRMGGGSGAERSIEVNNITDSTVVCAANSTGQGVANLNCGRDFRVAATGKQFQVGAYQATGSPQDAVAANTFVSWTFLRP